MKPERIQLNAPTPEETPSWGVYQHFEFVSLKKATTFANFVTEMAESHGRSVTCTINANRVTLFVPADATGQIAASVKFAGKVVELHQNWSAPAEES